MNININTEHINEKHNNLQNLIQSHRIGGKGFSEVLREKVKGVTFSAHAQSRIKSRNIPMDSESLEKLNSAVGKAASKGSRDSLILLANNAFIVNIPNKTVVTAMDGDSIKDNVFTNIDSTVIAG